MEKQDLVKIFGKHNPNTQMSEDESMMMMNILMTKDSPFNIDLDEMDKESKEYVHFKPVIDSFLGQIFLSRLRGLTTIKMSLGAFVMIMQHIQKPTDCVMYAYYLGLKLPKETLLTVNNMSDVFAWGFFNEYQLNKIWEAQKVDIDSHKKYQCHGAPDNMIDYNLVWEGFK